MDDSAPSLMPQTPYLTAKGSIKMSAVTNDVSLQTSQTAQIMEELFKECASVLSIRIKKFLKNVQVQLCKALDIIVKLDT